MIDTITAVLISVDESQLDACLASLQDQSFGKFDPIIHVNNISPQVKATNTALSQLEKHEQKEGWFVILGGDMILYKNAIELISNYMKDHTPNKKTIKYAFSLYDSFLEHRINGCPLRRTDIFSKQKRKDTMRNDAEVDRDLWQRGYEFKNAKHISIGTHFHDPTQFEIFRRFKMRGKKGAQKPKEGQRYLNTLIQLHHKYSESERYKDAIRAFIYGRDVAKAKDKSQNIEHDRKEFEEWLKVKNTMWEFQS